MVVQVENGFYVKNYKYSDYLCIDVIHSNDVIHSSDVITLNEKHSVFAVPRTNVKGEEGIWTFDNDFSGK